MPITSQALRLLVINRSLEAVGYIHTSDSSSKLSTLKGVEQLFIQSHRLNFEEGNQVGVGGFGEVMLATLDRSGEVAVKQLKTEGTTGDRKRLAIVSSFLLHFVASKRRKCNTHHTM